jgi:hypothetical protein
MRSVLTVTAAFGVVIGLGLGWWLRSAPNTKPVATAAITKRPPDSPTDYTSALAAIANQLAIEQNSRVALAKKLRSEIDRLTQAAEQAPSNLPASGGATAEEQARARIDQEGELAETWFSEEKLLEQGIPAGEIARLRQRFDEMELEKRYLRDFATRENWITSSRYTDALREINQELHTSLGDEDYDKVLYATGRNNRVRVSDTLQGSAAVVAGIRPGDVIIRYAGNRVFDSTALYLWSTQGKAGASTAVEISRNGEIVHLSIARGPLGAQLIHDRLAPGS